MVCCLDTLDGVLPRCSAIASGLCALGSTLDVVGSVAKLGTRHERSGQLFTSKENEKKMRMKRERGGLGSDRPAESASRRDVALLSLVEERGAHSRGNRFMSPRRRDGASGLSYTDHFWGKMRIGTQVSEV